VLLDDTHAEALRMATHPDIRDALAGWTSVRGGADGSDRRA
jgi:hypothetical protein